MFARYRPQLGFTLIELLVVIAIIGILAAVVLVAINPAERIKEASDSGAKSNLGQASTALESCYTAKLGHYNNCKPITALQSGGFLKDALSGITITGTDTHVIAYARLTAKSNLSAGGCTSAPAYLVYDTDTGDTTVECTQPTSPYNL
jgi:prepilin-type N-terminal cleavage/methylation domain-containing protein